MTPSGQLCLLPNCWNGAEKAERPLAEGDYVGQLGYAITSEWEQREDIKFFGRELKEIKAELRRRERR